jgi:hypothetical protein
LAVLKELGNKLKLFKMVSSIQSRAWA